MPLTVVGLPFNIRSETVNFNLYYERNSMKNRTKLSFVTGAALAVFSAGVVHAANFSNTLDLSKGQLVAADDGEKSCSASKEEKGCSGKKDKKCSGKKGKKHGKDKKCSADKKCSGKKAETTEKTEKTEKTETTETPAKAE
jgi:hypothetical protein